MATESGGIPVVAGAVPDVFADEAINFEITNGTVRISFSSVKMTEPAAPSPVHHEIIGRLIMPMASAQRLAIGLYDYLKQHGADPAGLIKEVGEVPN